NMWQVSPAPARTAAAGSSVSHRTSTTLAPARFRGKRATPAPSDAPSRRGNPSGGFAPPTRSDTHTACTRCPSAGPPVGLNPGGRRAPHRDGRVELPVPPRQAVLKPELPVVPRVLAARVGRLAVLRVAVGGPVFGRHLVDRGPRGVVGLVLAVVGRDLVHRRARPRRRVAVVLADGVSRAVLI